LFISAENAHMNVTQCIEEQNKLKNHSLVFNRRA
jgi:hypothetical protein